MTKKNMAEIKHYSAYYRDQDLLGVKPVLKHFLTLSTCISALAVICSLNNKFKCCVVKCVSPNNNQLRLAKHEPIKGQLQRAWLGSTSCVCVTDQDLIEPRLNQ